MHKAVGLSLAALALGALVACSDESASDGARPDSPARPAAAQTEVDPRRVLCPGCADWIATGGETGDFVNGATGPCGVNVTPVGRDFEGYGLSAPALVRLVERSSSAPGHYRATRYFKSWPAAPDIRGYGESPVVSVEIELLEIALLEEFGDPRGSTCDRKWLEFRARVDVSVSDGSLSGSFEQLYGGLYGSDEAYLTGSTDAAHFRGGLDLGAHPQFPFHNLVANLNLNLSPAAVRGALQLVVVTDDEALGAIDLEWPVDGCEPKQTPVEPAEYLPLLGQVRAELEDSYPMYARWAGPDDFSGRASQPGGGISGPETQLSLALEEPVQSACRVRFGSSDDLQSTYSFQTAARARTDDGRIDGSLPGSLAVDVGPSGELGRVLFDGPTIFRAEELESRYGIQGADLLGSDCGVMFFSAGLADGDLEIDTRPCADEGLEPMRLVEFLRWCVGSCSRPVGPLFQRPP